VFACSIGHAHTEDKAQPSTSKQDKPVAASSWKFEKGGQKDDHDCRHKGFMLQEVQEPWSQLPVSTCHAEPDWSDSFATDDCTCCSSPGRNHNHGCPDMGHYLHVEGNELVQVSLLELGSRTDAEEHSELLLTDTWSF
jgi:hypothetical protein